MPACGLGCPPTFRLGGCFGADCAGPWAVSATETRPTPGKSATTFSAAARKAIKQTYQTIYHSDLNVSQALAVLEGNIYSEEEERIAAFFLNSERGDTAHR